MFITPTEYPACRDAGAGTTSNRGGEAPRNEPASRSASKPEPASLHKVRVANLPNKLKPETRREAIFASSDGTLRGERGQRAGKVGLGRLGDPGRLFREKRDEVDAETIRRSLVAGESERPIVVTKRGNARGAKGPWRGSADSEGRGADWPKAHNSKPSPRLKSEAAMGRQVQQTSPSIQVPRESRMREIRMSGLTRGKGAGGYRRLPSLLYWFPSRS